MLSGGAAPPPPDLGERDEPDDVATDAADDERDRIVDAIGQTPVEVDAIIRFTGFRPAVVRLVLLELELAGRLEHHPGGRVSIVG